LYDYIELSINRGGQTIDMKITIKRDFWDRPSNADPNYLKRRNSQQRVKESCFGGGGVGINYK
jgi:hypothetical protein